MDCGAAMDLEIQPLLHLLGPEGNVSIWEGPLVCILSTQKGPFVKCLPCGFVSSEGPLFWNLHKGMG